MALLRVNRVMGHLSPPETYAGPLLRPAAAAGVKGAGDSEEVSPEVVLELFDGFRKSKTLFAALELGVFDALKQPHAGADSEGIAVCPPLSSCL